MTNIKKTIGREEEVIFTNWTDKDFTGVWNKKLYPLKAGKSYYLPFYLAEHFAKHLADREYNRVFNAKLEELKKKIGSQVDRATLEHRVQNSNEVQKMTIQEMIDKCVTEISEDERDIDIVKAKEVPLREAILRRDERAEQLREKYGKNIEVQINEKALRQKEEVETDIDQFEEEK